MVKKRFVAYIPYRLARTDRSRFVIKVSTHAFELNCTPYRLYHVGSIVAKMLLKQN